MTKEIKEEAFTALGIPPTKVVCDLFANHFNKQEKVYATRKIRLFSIIGHNCVGKMAYFGLTPLFSTSKGYGKNCPRTLSNCFVFS